VTARKKKAVAAAAEALAADPAEDAEAVEREPVRVPVFPVGVNYYPLIQERESWSDWYDRDVETDFAQLARAGFSLVRVFVSWKYFEQQVGQYADDADDRLARLVAAARDNKLKLIVTFFADDGFSELVDVPWAKGRDPRTDAYLVDRETALVQRIVMALRREEAIFAWDLGNEPFLARFESAEALRVWAAKLRDAIREIDKERPVTIGIDAETFQLATGIDARTALDDFGFVVSHPTAAYRIYATEGPMTSRSGTYLDSFLLHVARGALPVLLDDVGVFSLDYSAFEEAAHTRLALYSAVMNGAAGAVLRRFRDAQTENREPYFRDPYEVLVGVEDSDGIGKPSFAEARRFAKVALRLGRGGYALPRERVAVVMPAERWEPLPSLAGLHAPRSCLQAYVSAKEAHVPVTVVHEDEDLGAYRMLVVPSAFKLSAETWERIEAFVQGGGSLFASYGGGDAEPGARQLFGMEFLGDDGPRRAVSCRVAQPGMLGDLTSFDAALPVEHYALLGRGDAIVVATDATGNPLLTMNRFGQGQAVFLAVPAERGLAQPDTWGALSPVRDLLRAVYGSQAAAAGAAAPLACDRPEAEVVLASGDDGDVLMVLNHSGERVTANLTFERRVASVGDIRGGAPVPVTGPSFATVLAPFGAAVLRVTYV
jgi:endo-1,4-beta-mannosidase